MAFQNPTETLILGDEAGPHIVLSSDIPVVLAAFYSPATIATASLMYTNTTDFYYEGITSNGFYVCGLYKFTTGVVEIFRSGGATTTYGELNNQTIQFGDTLMGTAVTVKVDTGSALTVNGTANFLGSLIANASGTADFFGATTIHSSLDWGGSTTVEAINTAFVSTVSTTYVALTGDPSVNFTAPPSGRVMVNVSSAMTQNTAGQMSRASFEIRDGTTLVTVVAASDNFCVGQMGTDDQEFGRASLITGLTPGHGYNARMLYRADASGTAGFARRKVSVMPAL